MPNDEEEWQSYLDAAADKVDLARVTREALERLARECLRWDASTGFPSGPLSDALERVCTEGKRD